MRKYCPKSSRGLTLIELLVVMVLIAIGISATFAGYRNFDRTQKVRQAALTLKNNLRLAQTKAIAVDHPASCEELDSIDVDISANNYKLAYYCGSDIDIITIDLPTGITITPSTRIKFTPMTGDVSTGPVTITLAYGSAGFEIIVSEKGVIECKGQGASGLKCY
jgi:prepilin-type N-terminal cleavage/methylation domain-containing protein